MSSTRRQACAVALAAACLGGSAACGAAQEHAIASSIHDGVYTVEILTQRGSCDRAYHWTISVAEGRITSPPDGFMQASGQVNADGAVSLAFRRDQQVANVAGRVEGRTGSGTWSSATLQCAGSWNAQRIGVARNDAR